MHIPGSAWWNLGSGLARLGAHEAQNAIRAQTYILSVTNYDVFSTSSVYFEIMGQADLFEHAVIPGWEGAHGEHICSVSEVKHGFVDKICFIFCYPSCITQTKFVCMSNISTNDYDLRPMGLGRLGHRTWSP